MNSIEYVKTQFYLLFLFTNLFYERMASHQITIHLFINN